MKKIDCDGIIFDMDGVLIDVRKSFRMAAKKTVEYVLKNKYKLLIKVKADDIKAMKNIPGFNNDWDLSFTLINLLKNNVKRNDFGKYAKQLPKDIRENPDYKEMMAINETFCWGNEIFYQLYNYPAPFSFKTGLLNNESLLIKKDVFEKLASSYPLGLATGRTRFETLYSLKKFQIMPFFKEDFIITDEDTIEKKPNPAPLLKVKERMKVKKPVYVGDTINDVVAAKKAKMPCIYIGNEKLGDFQIKDVNQIMEVLL